MQRLQGLQGLGGAQTAAHLGILLKSKLELPALHRLELEIEGHGCGAAPAGLERVAGCLSDGLLLGVSQIAIHALGGRQARRKTGEWVLTGRQQTTPSGTTRGQPGQWGMLLHYPARLDCRLLLRCT